jgi:hypothetical protein
LGYGTLPDLGGLMDMDFGEWMDWITEVEMDPVELAQWMEWCEWYTSTALQHEQSNYDLSWTITTQAEQ